MVMEREENEERAREERHMGAFDRVCLDGVGHADVCQGDEDHLVIEAPERVMQDLESRVDDGTLVLRVRHGASWAGLRGDSIHYEITMRRIRGLAIDGSGSIRVPRAVSESLDASIDGAGRIDIGEVEVQKLTLAIDGCGRIGVDHTNADDACCSVDGAGTIDCGQLTSRSLAVAIDGQGRLEARGKTESLAVAIDGTGSVLARQLRARAVAVSIDGMGKIVAWPEELLEARIEGYGRVEYVGRPSSIRQRVEGAGGLVRLGDPEEVPETAGIPSPGG